MTGETRMFDWLKEKNYPTKKEAEDYADEHGGINGGLQKAIDSFYGEKIIEFKKGGNVRMLKNQKIVSQDKRGRFRTLRGLGRFAKRLREET